MNIFEERLEDIKNNPEQHRHSYDALVACCTIDGIVHFSLIHAHARYVDIGFNGGVRCDVTDGPCACGAWH